MPSTPSSSRDRLIGYNTDAEGFVRAIDSFGEIRSALILGAGGTARALAIALRAQGMEISVLNRSPGRLDYFKEEGFGTYTWDSFTSRTFDMLINTTSAGLSDNELPLPAPLLADILTDVRCAVDVIYGKETPFLREVKTHGLPYKDGSDMLLQQGGLANHLFLRCKYPPEDIEPAMKESFLY